MQYEQIIVKDPWKAFGMTKRAYLAWIEEDAKNWCQEHDGAESYYHRDNECVTDICPKKHHYHCEQCGLLTQIG